MAAELPYRPAVGVMLIGPGARVFVGQRLDSTLEAWQMPQGGIDEGETAEEAAWRELGEEVGTSAARIVAQSRDWLTYDLPEELVGRLWGGRYRGQRQQWFAMRFTGSDADIDIATPEPEFRAWRWVDATELPALIVPFKRRLYEAVLGKFDHVLAAERARA